MHQQMRENAGAADLRLSPEDLRKVADLWRREFTP